MEENGERDRECGFGRKHLDHETDVLEDVAFGVILGRLLATVQSVDLGNDLLHEAAVDQQVEAAQSARVDEDP